MQGPIRRQEDNDEHTRLSTKTSTTPNKKARKDDHHGEYRVMKGRLRGKEEIDVLLWCTLMTPTNFDNGKNHFAMRRDVPHGFRR